MLGKNWTETELCEQLALVTCTFLANVLGVVGCVNRM